MKKYYAANNTFGTESSFGFANTWFVLAFSNKVDRDNYVDCCSEVSATKIKRSEIKEYVDKPKPFSGKSRVIACGSHEIKGCIGEVVVDYNDYGMAL